MTSSVKTEVNLVVSGGASHGATLWGGVLTVLGKYRVVRGLGASIGAVIVAGVCFGLDRLKLEAALVALFQNNKLTGGKPLVRFHPRCLWARGGGMHDWSHVRAALKELFGDLRMRDAQIPCTIVVADVYTGRPVYVTSESHPDALVWEVLTCSTAIAPFADAQTAPSMGTGNRLYIDGGWGNNIPVEPCADTDEPTVVLFLSTGGAVPVVEKREGILGVAKGCLENALYADPDLRGRTDDIMVPIVPHGSGLDFNLTGQEIHRRVVDGAAQTFRILNRR